MPNTSSETEAIKILNMWEEFGEESGWFGNPDIPRHPEFIYRISGDWCGWSHFIGSPNSEENYTRDIVENLAWEIFENNQSSL